jgi:hypothetical protein
LLDFLASLGMDPAVTATLLEEVADRALRSEFEPVACLQAPEPVRAPLGLLRADGRSVYQRHGGVRFATHAQLTMEQRMLALARWRRAAHGPRRPRAPCVPDRDRGDDGRAHRLTEGDLDVLELASLWSFCSYLSTAFLYTNKEGTLP